MEIPDFKTEVYSIVKEIPAGKLLTYGQIACLAGKPSGSRQVGYALHHAPPALNLPCHRVVNSTGKTAPGWAEQRELLEKEGISFKTNGCADLKKHLWKEAVP